MLGMLGGLADLMPKVEQMAKDIMLKFDTLIGHVENQSARIQALEDSIKQLSEKLEK